MSTMAGSSGGLAVRVLTPKLQTDFTVKRSTTGKQLLRQVADILDLRERWFFGMQFIDDEGKRVWLLPEERLTSRAAHGKQSPLEFTFCVRFWPQEAAWTLSSETTELLFLQVRQSVLDGTLFCPPGTAIELAAYALQARCGDFVDARLESGQLTRNRHLPQKLEGPLRGATEQWQERVATLHRKLRGLPRRNAMHEYLHRVQQLPGYGVTFSKIRCDHLLGGQPAGRCCWFWMGVSPYGVNVYEDRLTPLHRFPWEQLRSIRIQDCKLTINLADNKKVKCITQSLRKSKELLSTIMGQLNAINVQKQHGDGEELSTAAGGSSSEEAQQDAAEGGAELDCDQCGGSCAAEDAAPQAGACPAWVEPLAAAGWLPLVQQWRSQEPAAGGPASEAASLPCRRVPQQSCDSGLVSWSGSASDALTSGDAELTSTDTELTSSDPAMKRYSAASADSGVLRLSVTSDEVFV